MRVLVKSMVAALFLCVSWTVPAQAGGHHPGLWIKPTASPIYQYDGSGTGEGPTFPATDLRAFVKKCPAGDYEMNATLKQDGVSMDWATTGRGAGEVFCTGSGVELRMGFYGPTLHPGKAKAYFALHKVTCTDGVCTVSERPTVKAWRVVHIPRCSRPVGKI